MVSMSVETSKMHRTTSAPSMRKFHIGCGHGASTILMAQAFPKSSFVGLDYHDASIATAAARAAEQGVTGNIAFEVKAATEFDGHDFDLICFMDCLHDLGDPVGALARCRATLKPDGKVLLVEPYAGDRLEENLNPVGRMYYAASAMACACARSRGNRAFPTCGAPPRRRST